MLNFKLFLLPKESLKRLEKYEEEMKCAKNCNILIAKATE